MSPILSPSLPFSRIPNHRQAARASKSMANWGGRLEFSATRARIMPACAACCMWAFFLSLDSQHPEGPKSGPETLSPLENDQGMSENHSKKCILKSASFRSAVRLLQSRQIKGALIMTETPGDTGSQSERSKPNLSTSETFDTGDRRPPGANHPLLMGVKHTYTNAQLSSASDREEFPPRRP